MRVIVENAGAQRGLLDPEPRRSPGGRGPGHRRRGERSRSAFASRLSNRRELAASVVQYVSRSKETLVLPDAAADPRFARDPYVASQRPRSVLCLAMQHRGRLVGVLYLENNAATNAFSVERVDLAAVHRCASGGRSRKRYPLRRATRRHGPAAAGERHARRSRSPNEPRSSAVRWPSSGARWISPARSRPSSSRARPVSATTRCRR